MGTSGTAAYRQAGGVGHRLKDRQDRNAGTIQPCLANSALQQTRSKELCTGTVLVGWAEVQLNDSDHFEQSLIDRGATRVVLALGADEAFALYLTVALTSALRHLPAASAVAVYVIDGGMSAASLDRIRANATRVRPDANIHFVSADRTEISALPSNKRISAATYLRLLLPSCVPPDVATVLYLDFDVLVTEDVSPLFATDLGDQVCGAVADRSGHREMSRLRCSFPAAAIPEGAGYFNAGVILLNMKAWRNRRISERALELLEEHPDLIRLHDQDALNLAVADDWVKLPPRWNTQIVGTSLHLPDTPRTGELGILHFVTGLKPWYASRRCLYEDQYLSAMLRLDWLPLRRKLRLVSRFVWRGLRADFALIRQAIAG